MASSTPQGDRRRLQLLRLSGTRLGAGPVMSRDRRNPDGGCGCGRGFASLASHRLQRRPRRSSRGGDDARRTDPKAMRKVSPTAGRQVGHRRGRRQHLHRLGVPRRHGHRAQAQRKGRGIRRPRSSARAARWLRRASISSLLFIEDRPSTPSSRARLRQVVDGPLVVTVSVRRRNRRRCDQFRVALAIRAAFSFDAPSSRRSS